MGQKENHIELPALRDFACSVVSMDAKSKNHIEICGQCQSNLKWLQWLADFGVRERSYEPPAWVTANAGKVFRLKKPGFVTVAKEIIANLVYDSFNEPLPAGVRQQARPPRQTLYSTDKLQLDLKIDVSDEGGLIIGQIIAYDIAVNTTGLRIELTESGHLIGKSSTNALGEFILQGLPKGHYELQVVLPDTLVKLPPLSLDS